MTTAALCNVVESGSIRPNTFSFSILSWQKFGVLEISISAKNIFFFFGFDKDCTESVGHLWSY